MMGTFILYSSGDAGVAGKNITRGISVCLNSKRKCLDPGVLSRFVLTFVYEVQEVNGTVFNPSYPVRADLISFYHNDVLF